MTNLLELKDNDRRNALKMSVENAHHCVKLNY